MRKHAPSAPGPRPNTWWKRRPRPQDGQLTQFEHGYVIPPIYTRPEPARNNPAEIRLPDIGKHR